MGAAAAASAPTVTTATAPAVPAATAPAAALAALAATPAAQASAAQVPAAIRVFAAPMRSGGIQVKVTAAHAGYVYCYAQDPTSKAIRRIFPNRFVRDPRVEAGHAVTLPGAARFVLAEDQQFGCVHAPREVYNDLPPPLRWGDFEDIRLASFDEIRRRFEEASGTQVTLARP